MKFLTLFVVLIICKFSSGFFGSTRYTNTHQEPVFQVSKTSGKFATPTEEWIEQRVDNFNPQDTRRWQMRYYQDLSLLEPNGPIFIYLGGEWTISSRSIMEGYLIHEMAKENQGALFYTEHRFYGQSHPTPDTKTENLKYLSIDQALADVAYFIEYIKSTVLGLEESKVILVGASYSATMAAWMRMKYPHLVAGSFASSGPVFAKVDFYEYKEVMAKAIQDIGGDECTDIINNAFDDMEELVDQKNTTRISEAFVLCQELELPIDIPHFFYEVSDIVAGLVQTHRNVNIQNACTQMKNARNFTDDIGAFASWVRGDSALVSKGIKQPVGNRNAECLDFSYTKSMETFSNYTWGSLGNQQMRQWIYQTCAEFAWFQTSTSTDQIFGSTYGVDYFYRICNDLYDNKFSRKMIEFNVARTNAVYGGFGPELTNVVFTNGAIDPWHPMSVLEDLNESATSLKIPLSAHVSDLGATSDNDSKEMRTTKEKVKNLVLKWIGVDNME
ncbi:hypothetical protein ACKWTF_004586 [Chironomus riparius]